MTFEKYGKRVIIRTVGLSNFYSIPPEALRREHERLRSVNTWKQQHLTAFQETPISSTEDQAQDLTVKEIELPNRLNSKLGQVSCV